MIVFAIDPSLTCTGWAILESTDGLTSLHAAGTVKNDEGTACKRSYAIAAELDGELLEFAKTVPDRFTELVVVIETPQTFSKGRGPRSAATLPNYGIIVGVIYAHFRTIMRNVVEVSASTWAIGSRVKGDKDKTVRVLAVEQKFGLKHGSLGCKSDAGNVADAVLLGEWWINQQRLEAAEIQGDQRGK